MGFIGVEWKPETGIYENIPFDQYLACPYWNSSSIKHGLKSMAHVRAAKDDSNQEDKPHFRLGSFVHAAVLEPHRVLAQYVVMPDFAEELRGQYRNPRNTKAYRQKVADFQDATAGREAVSQAQYDTMSGVLESLANNPVATQYLAAPGMNEVSFIWEQGVKCRARADKYTPGVRLVDLKTSSAADVARQVFSLRYHLQLAFYLEGLFRSTGERLEEACLIVCETSPPYATYAAPLSEEAIDLGRDQCREILAKIAECEQSGKWPGPENPPAWDVPAWAMPQQQIMINGELVTL